MNESIRDVAGRQARWQKSRRLLSWEEKIRLIESVKDEFARLLPVYRKKLRVVGQTEKPGFKTP